MAHLPRLLAILVFLGIHVSAPHGSPLPRTYDDSMCSKSFSCGGVNISYPFYLSNATQASNYTSSYSCGYTGLKIFCHGEGDTGTPILQLGEDNNYHNYTVKDISYNNYTIVLADPVVLVPDNHCPAVRHNVTVSPDWLNYTESLGRLTFFFNCDILPDAEMYRINCTGFNSPGPGGRDRPSFVLSRSDEHDDGLEDVRCREIVVVPVHRDALLGSNPLTLPWQYGSVLQQGFELEWSRGPPQAAQACDLCELSQGQCAYSEMEEFLGCLCSGGKVGAQNCSSSGASNAPSSASGKFLQNRTFDFRCLPFHRTTKSNCVS